MSANAETVAQTFDVNPKYTAVAYNPPVPTLAKANPTNAYKGSISVTEVIKATGLGNYPAVLNGVFGYRGNVLTSQQLAERIQKATYEEKRTLQIARELNNILVTNQNKEAYRDDAWATAQGIQCIASYNTYNGKLNLEGFKNHLAQFFIDQTQDNKNGHNNNAIASNFLITGKGDSPLARQLFGGDRIGAYGYAKNIQELVYNNQHKRLEPSNGTNQAHHLAFYLLSGMKIGVKFSVQGSRKADEDNLPDLQLAKIGARLGEDIKNNRIVSNKIGAVVYEQLRSGNFKP